MFFPIRDDVPHFRPPYITILLIVLNSIIFLFELILPREALMGLFFHFGIVPRRLTEGIFTSGVWLPFFTSTFLHGSFSHLLGNMWFLWLFGDNVEDRFGHFRFLVFYLLCGVTAGLFQTIHSPYSPYPVIGASGAIAGVMGAYFLMYPLAKIRVLFLFIILPIFFDVPAMFFLPLWFLSQVMNVMSPMARISHVAWWAHIGGFMVGMTLAPMFDRGYGWRLAQRQKRRLL